MKTTVEIPDALFIAAKKRAAEERRPLRALVEEGLRSVLTRKAASPAKRRVKIHWVTSGGGLPPGLDMTDRTKMWDWFQKERGRGST